MDTRFTAEMSEPRTPATGSTLTMIQVKANKDLAFLQPYLSFDGEDPTDPKFLVEIVRGLAEWTGATEVAAPPAHDTRESDAATDIAAAINVWETSASPAAEPSGTAVVLHSFYVHAQGGWVCPFTFPLAEGETLGIRLVVPATSHSVLAGFIGRVA